jgi:hypothetical protein
VCWFSCGRQPLAEVRRHDLGRVPPGIHARLAIPVGAFDHDTRLDQVSSSCGCLQAELRSSAGETVAPGAPLVGGQPYALHALFAPPRSQPGPGNETVRIALASGGAARELRIEIAYEIDEAQSSIADRGRLVIEREVPVPAIRHAIDLRRPLSRSAIELEALPWLRLADQAVADQANDEPSQPPLAASQLVLELGPFEADGIYESIVSLRVAADRTEKAVLRIDARRPGGFGVRPSTVVLSLPGGGALAHPMTLSGPMVDVVPAAALWEEVAGEEVRLGRGPALAAYPGLGFEVVGQGDGSASLLFRVDRALPVGLHRGRLLIRPYPDAIFRLSVPYLVRVF